VHVKERHAREDCGAKRGEPQDALAGCKRSVSSLDNADGFVASGVGSGALAHVDGEAFGAGEIVVGHWG